jgi:hypothetical protein
MTLPRRLAEDPMGSGKAFLPRGLGVTCDWIGEDSTNNGEGLYRAILKSPFDSLARGWRR